MPHTQPGTSSKPEPLSRLQFLLIQIRDHDDPILHQEVDCFSHALKVDTENIATMNLLDGVPSWSEIRHFDAFLVGGSGDYSVVSGGKWLAPSMHFFRELCEAHKPVFASCWGFQAIAKALGGVVVTDLERAEVGTIRLKATELASSDPIFSNLGTTFEAQLGHQDIVDHLPPNSALLCSSEKVINQAFRLMDRPIYATQFHPELDDKGLIKRLVAYPEYVKKITGLEMRQFVERCRPSEIANEILLHFKQLVHSLRLN